MVVGVSAVIYWIAARGFDAGRGDFFYLADAFLHGRTWLTFRPGPNDVIVLNGHVYVPFAPFPAVALMPVVAVLGAVGADQAESGINAVLAAMGVGLCWVLLARIGVRRLVDRLVLDPVRVLHPDPCGSPPGGVWHTGQLVATILTFLCLIEVFGRQRAWIIGVTPRGVPDGPAGVRDPVLRADARGQARRDGRRGDRAARGLPSCGPFSGGAVGAAPRRRARAAFLLAYNQIRFGSPWGIGYGLASAPLFLEEKRAQGMFSWYTSR